MNELHERKHCDKACDWLLNMSHTSAFSLHDGWAAVIFSCGKCHTILIPPAVLEHLYCMWWPVQLKMWLLAFFFKEPSHRENSRFQIDELAYQYITDLMWFLALVNNISTRASSSIDLLSHASKIRSVATGPWQHTVCHVAPNSECISIKTETCLWTSWISFIMIRVIDFFAILSKLGGGGITITIFKDIRAWW